MATLQVTGATAAASPETEKGAAAASATPSSTVTKTLALTKKGPFFADRFFLDCRDEFQAALKLMLTKLKIKTIRSEEFNAYRNVRKVNPKNDNQVVSQKDTDKLMRVSHVLDWSKIL